MIVDAHTHVFSRVAGRIEAGPVRGVGYGQIRIGNSTILLMPPLSASVRHTPKMLISAMDWAKVDRAVLLQGPFYGECNDYVLEAVTAYPDRLSAAAYFDPWAKASMQRRQDLEAILAVPAYRAIKLECSVPTGFYGLYPHVYLNDPNLDWIWSELASADLVLTLDLGAVGTRSYQTETVHRIATHHPTLKIVIAHLGQPLPSMIAEPPLWQAWCEQIDLGKLPNVWFDTAALPYYVEPEPYPFPTVEKYLHAAIDRIGPAKIMFGTDTPSLLRIASYRQLIDVFKCHIAALSATEKAMLLGRNAVDVYGKT